jgi:tetratricopeptide (TPR) repeat protein
MMQRWIAPSAWALGALAIFWTTTFNIMDRDFWWHITAGKVLLDSGWISIDPFAYTRAGLPYLATHEWLAQIVLYLIHDAFGSTGIILFRGIVACAAVGLLLPLARRASILALLPATWAIVITKGSFLERPQLFTFVFFSLFLLLSFRFLDTHRLRTKIHLCIALVVAELLWVNMHGAAALLGCAIVTFAFLQETWNWRKDRTNEQRTTVALLFGTLVTMAVVLVLPPNGWSTIGYLNSLLHDQTIVYIAEWRARDFSLYITELWPFWILALSSLWFADRHRIFSAFVLLMTAYASRQAFRHEILFVLASLSLCFYHTSTSERAKRLRERIVERKKSSAAVTLIAILLLARVAYVRSMDFERQDGLHGFGEFDLARGAYDFLERENITGNMFNTYGIGGYLIHRGYPERKVFIDGRNVDYGMDFMTRTYAAGVNRDEWDHLVERYAIDYAIIDYDAIREQDRLPYGAILDEHPDWSLVYLDDWVAVYLRRTPEHEHMIDRLGYDHLTATILQFNDGFRGVPAATLPLLEPELQRARRESPESIKATLALATLALRTQRNADAKSLAQEAIKLRPHSPEAYAILGAAYVEEEQWEWAADAYETLLSNVGNTYPDINYGFIADVFAKANRPWKARYYRLFAPKDPTSAESEHLREPQSTETGTGTPSETAPAMANPAADAVEFNDRGVEAAEAGRLDDAETSLRTAVMLNPSYAEAWNNLCALHISQKLLSDAIDACSRAITIDEAFADAHYNLALAQYHDGSPDLAKAHALRAKELGRVDESDALLLLIGKM